MAKLGIIRESIEKSAFHQETSEVPHLHKVSKVWEMWVEVTVLGFKIKHILLLKIHTLSLVMREHQTDLN